MHDLLSLAVSNAVAAAVLAVVALAVGAMSRRPALMHGLWLLVLLKLVTPPLVRIPIAWPTTEEPLASETLLVREETLLPMPDTQAQEPLVIDLSPREEATEGAAFVPDDSATIVASEEAISFDWTRWLRIVWLSGSVGWFSLAVARLHRFCRLLRYARPASSALQERTRRLARSLGLARCPQVRLLPGRIAPMLWAVGGVPRLFVPADLLAALSKEQLDTLLLHELAHQRRRDHWVRVLEFAVMGLYWWHPVVWYARRELREAEEQCCDAWVVSTLPDAGRAYASALLDTLDFLSTTPSAAPPLASGLGQVADLKRRLTMIMSGTTPRALSWPGCLAVLCVGAFFLPLLPAQAPPPVPTPPPQIEEIKKTFRVGDLVIALGDDDAAKKLAEAKVRVNQLEADLQVKQAMLEQAKAHLALTIAQKRNARVKEVPLQTQKTSPEGKTVHRWTVVTADEKKPSIRIEIVADGNFDVNDIAKKLKEILPNSKARISISTSNENHNFDIGSGARLRLEPKPAPKGFRIEVQPTPAVKPPTPTKPVPPPPAAMGSATITVPRHDKQEDRMRDLEKKLEKVLQELHDMRKQMKGDKPVSALPVDPTATNSQVEITLTVPEKEVRHLKVRPIPEKTPVKP